MRNTGPSEETRDKIAERSRGYCERCGTDVIGQPVSVHHRKPRRMGGTKNPDINTLPNLMLLCGSGTTGCHGVVESFRERAYAEGYLVNAQVDPAETPVFVARVGWCLLDKDGGYVGVDR